MSAKNSSTSERLVRFLAMSLLTLSAGSSQGAVYFIHSDHIGTPKVISDVNQQVVWKASHDPFGAATVTIATVTNNLRFPGQYFDAENGTHYNYFRDMDPSIGRYLQSDPIGLEGGINVYAYALNNPIRFTDPAGLDVRFCFYSGGSTHIAFQPPGLSSPRGFHPIIHSPFAPGVIKEDDPNADDAVCKTAKTDFTQDECMDRCRKTRERDPGTYNVVTRQCTEFVRSCAVECGIVDDDDVTTSKFPRRLYNDLPGS